VVITTVINTARFGEIEINDDKIISFAQGMPGLEHLKRYVFLTPAHTYPLFFLQALDDSNISLPVINPFDVMKDYNPSVSELVLKELELDDLDNLLLLNVVVVPADIRKMTVNMAAPILINVKNFKGRQVILDNSRYPIRYPLFETFIKLRNGGVGSACPVQEEK